MERKDSSVSMALLASPGQGLLSSVGRKYVVYSELEAEPLCDSSPSISTFTFLNFLAASVSLAALLGSNTNSNNNNNNQNNNQVVTALASIELGALSPS